jgi:hypothetical protein
VKRKTSSLENEIGMWTERPVSDCWNDELDRYRGINATPVLSVNECLSGVVIEQ